VTVLSPTASNTTGGDTSPSGSASQSTSASPSASQTPSQSPEPSPSPIPTEAPVTGGGGTAGFQDTWLAVLGVAAIVAGLVSIAYRYRMTRRR
jgi:hypothetical protein